MSRERSIRGAAGFLFLVAWMLAPNTRAQVAGELSFTTTFPFTAGNATLPAGAYEIRPVDNEPNIIEISAVEGGPSAFVEVAAAPIPVAQADTTRVTFKQYAGGYVLKGIWDEADRRNMTTAVSYAEKTHAAKDPAPTDQQVMAARGGKR